MANETTTSTADDLVHSYLIAEEVLEAAWPQLVCLPQVKEYDISSQATLAKKVPRWGTVSAAAVAESDDLSYSALSTDSITLTASEVGVVIMLKDKLTMSDILAGIDDYSAQLGKALADKIDADVAALFSGFTNSVGSSGVNITEANFLEAIYTLENANAPYPFVSILHPIQVHDLRGVFAGTTGVIHSQTTPNQIGTKQNGFFTTLYNVDVWMTTNVATANTAADRCGAMFSQGQTLGVVWKYEAKVELERDASARGTEVVVTGCYGVGELVDSYGVKIVTDA